MPKDFELMKVGNKLFAKVGTDQGIVTKDVSSYFEECTLVDDWRDTIKTLAHRQSLADVVFIETKVSGVFERYNDQTAETFRFYSSEEVLGMLNKKDVKVCILGVKKEVKLTNF